MLFWTLNLDNDIGEVAARMAKARGVSLGKAVSDLVRRSLRISTPYTAKNGLIVFNLPKDSPQVSTQQVRRIEADGA